MRRVVLAIVMGLPPRDRLRLSYYYAQELTLAQIGHAFGEHEATASRNLARVRREVRAGVERHLREREGLTEAEIAECFEAIVQEGGMFDMNDLLGAPAPGVDAGGPPAPDEARKDSRSKRSKGRAEGANA
jgi:hypothetical protein